MLHWDKVMHDKYNDTGLEVNFLVQLQSFASKIFFH